MKYIPKVNFLDAPPIMFLSIEMTHDEYHRIPVPECPLCEIGRLKYEPGKLKVLGPRVGKGVSILPSEPFKGFKAGELYDWSRLEREYQAKLQSRQEDKDN